MDTVSNAWDLADAKNRLSELFSKALTEGPQRITRRGEAVILLAEEEYNKLRAPRKSFVQYLMDGPSLEGLDLSRDQSPARDIEL